MTTPTVPPATLRAIRIILGIVHGFILGAMAIGVLAFTFVLILIIASPSTDPPPDPHAMNVMLVIAVWLALINVSLGYLLQWFIMRRLARRNSGLAATIIWYHVVKIAAWALCEGPIFFALVICLMMRSFWPAGLIAAPCFLAMILNLPLCRPLRRFALPAPQ